MEKSVTLKHIGFRCGGTATLILWDGNQGDITMNSWDTKTGDIDVIAKGVNDAQFGCESIESAEINIYDLYENNYTIFNKTIILDKEKLKEAKRGI